MQMKNFAYALILAASLAACHKTPAEPPKPAGPVAPQPPAAAKIDNAELMRAVFGDAYNAQSKSALATLSIEGSDVPHAMTPVATTQLPDGRLALIVNGSPAGEDGSDMSAHVSAGVLNVYLLQRDGAQWKVLERHQNVAMLGSSGEIGSVKWVMLGPGKPGFIVFNGGIWQGYSISHAAIFELGGDVRSLGSFKQASSSEGACGPTQDECWDVAGDISFAAEPQPSGYSDIVVSFDDKRYTVTEEKNGDLIEHVKSNTKTSVRYHFDGKEYILASGVNPAPDI